MSVTERETKKNDLDNMAEKTIAGMIKQDAGLQKKIDKALGYGVANMKVTKVPIIGAGGGEGVFVNSKTKKRTYFTVTRLDIGGGWGARSYKILMVVDSKEILDSMKGGYWEFNSGVEASVGTASADNSSHPADAGFSLHVLSDGGASATATVRVINVKVSHELSVQ
jgi:hypothetical protein